MTFSIDMLTLYPIFLQIFKVITGYYTLHVYKRKERGRKREQKHTYTHRNSTQNRIDIFRIIIVQNFLLLLYKNNKEHLSSSDM